MKSITCLGQTQQIERKIKIITKEYYPVILIFGINHCKVHRNVTLHDKTLPIQILCYWYRFDILISIQEILIKYYSNENILEHHKNCKYMIPPLIKFEMGYHNPFHMLYVQHIIYNTRQNNVTVKDNILLLVLLVRNIFVKLNRC